jgi:hypothetical protein
MPFFNPVVSNFTTGEELYTYACLDRQPDWEPWCDFPYINAGFGPNVNDITLNDCSQLYSETQPYLLKRIIYSCINFAILCVSLQHVSVCFKKKKEQKRESFNSNERGVSTD